MTARGNPAVAGAALGKLSRKIFLPLLAKRGEGRGEESSRTSQHRLRIPDFGVSV
jgi:hypothetical protein